MPSGTVQTLTAILGLLATMPIDVIAVGDDAVLENALGELQVLTTERERHELAFAEALSGVAEVLERLARDARRRHAELRRALRLQSARGLPDPATEYDEVLYQVRVAVCTATGRALRLACRACLAPSENRRSALISQVAANVGEALYLTILATEGTI